MNVTVFSNWAQLLLDTVQDRNARCALIKDGIELCYGDFAEKVRKCAAGLSALGLQDGERVAVFLPKSFEAVISFCAVAQAGFVLVPVNPSLKAEQVQHILKDCSVRVLISHDARLAILNEIFPHLTDLSCIFSIDGSAHRPWTQLLQTDPQKEIRGGGNDLSLILYTSGSTGKAKGVMVSHANLIAGARIVADYLELNAEDRILALLPFSFDYGLNQLLMALLIGAPLILQDYILPGEVLKTIERQRVSVLACVPPLWHQIVHQNWPEAVAAQLRVLTNSGGRMSGPLLQHMQALFPQGRIFLMYGLTEAFRSTYLDPMLLNDRPDSVGKAVPGEEVLVVRADGTLCDPDETGELVHIGRLVTQGYWGDDERTAQRFRPAPQASQGAKTGQMAVWSGDKARRDGEGYLYFVGRDDEMIKTSGYRVSPTEVEEALMRADEIAQAVVLGVKDDVLGEVITAVVTAKTNMGASVKNCEESVFRYLRSVLPSFMMPQKLIWKDHLPMGPNGKIDRNLIRAQVLKELGL